MALCEGTAYPYIKKCTLPVPSLSAIISSLAQSSLFAVLCVSCSSVNRWQAGFCAYTMAYFTEFGGYVKDNDG